jgi:hypothetical protein
LQKYATGRDKAPPERLIAHAEVCLDRRSKPGRFTPTNLDPRELRPASSGSEHGPEVQKQRIVITRAAAHAVLNFFKAIPAATEDFPVQALCLVAGVACPLHCLPTALDRLLPVVLRSRWHIGAWRAGAAIHI